MSGREATSSTAGAYIFPCGGSTLTDRQGELLMKRGDDLPHSLFDRRIAELESRSTQSDVCKHSVGLEAAGVGRTDDESCRPRGHRPHAQRSVGEAREPSRKLVHADRLAVHGEVPAACRAVLGEVYQRTGAVANVNGRDPRPALPKLQHATTGHDRIDD